MMKIKSAIAKLDALHQLPEGHPITQDRISLAHINTQALLRADRDRFERNKAKGIVREADAASQFAVGQIVRTTRRMGADFLTGQIVSIDAGKITLDNGSTFIASVLVAA